MVPTAVVKEGTWDESGARPKSVSDRWTGQRDLSGERKGDRKKVEEKKPRRRGWASGAIGPAPKTKGLGAR